MSALNWKDRANTGGSEARASREIGGRYRIVRLPGGYETWRGEIAETVYEIQFCRSHRRDWNDVAYGRTLAEAKRVAEEDHEERRREAATAR
jgi:hypothetical protein